MDISNSIKAGSVAPSVVKVTTEASVVGQTSATLGNSLPDVRQVRARVADQPQPSTGSVSQPNTEELNNLVEQANVTLQGRFSDLKFTVAEGTDINVVRIEDAKTGELIRQVPSEAMVAIARALDEAQRGMMLEEKV